MTKNKEPELVTATELSKLHNCTLHAIQKAGKQGRIVPYKIVNNKKYFDKEKALEMLRTTSQIGQDDVAATDYYTHRARKEKALAEDAEYNLAIKKRDYVLIEDVHKAAADSAVTIKEAMTNIPDRIADRVATETDTKKVYKLLVEEINGALKDYVEQQRRTLGILESDT